MLSADLQHSPRCEGREQPNAQWGGNPWVFSGQKCRESSPRMLQQAWHGLPGARSSFSIALQPLTLVPGTSLIKGGDPWSCGMAQPAVSVLLTPLKIPYSRLGSAGLSTK